MQHVWPDRSQHSGLSLGLQDRRSWSGWVYAEEGIAAPLMSVRSIPHDPSHTHPPIPVPLIPAAASVSHDDWCPLDEQLFSPGRGPWGPKAPAGLLHRQPPCIQHPPLRHPIACLVLLPHSFPSAQLLTLPGFWKHPVTRTASLAWGPVSPPVRAGVAPPAPKCASFVPSHSGTK